MEYRCISADCHIDLSWLPHDLFVVNASTAMRDRMPYVEQDGPAGPRWTTKSGLSMGLANGKGSKGALGVGTPFVAGRTHRDDRIAATGLYEDGSKGILRPTTPELRIRDQDRDGVQAEVMYGLHGHGHKIKDQESEFAGTFSYRGVVALAQSVANYPSKPIRMIIAYAPGGAVDVVGRIVAIELSKAWGQSVIPNNEAGGSGTVGLNQGMKATPDGYTLMM